MADNSETIKDNSQTPRRASGDSGSVEQHSIPDQIAADKYAESKAASRARHMLRMGKISPGGAI